MRRRIVVLGASGFLGTAITRYLADLGHEVTAYCRHPGGQFSGYPNVKSVSADLRDTWTLTQVLTGVDIVYHFASATYPSLFFSNPSAEYTEAIQPLLGLMECAAHAGVKKIVFPSSGGTIYADSRDARTEESPTDPRSPYAIFKLAAESLLHHSARLGQFSVDVFRIGNPYGPGQKARPGQGVLTHWIHSIQNSEPITVFGDGSAARDYIFVDDLCHLMSVSLHRLEECGTFNLGTGVATSLSELLGHVQSLAASPLKAIYLPGRVSDIASISLASDRLLKLVPDFSFTALRNGLEKTLRYHGIGI